LRFVRSGSAPKQFATDFPFCSPFWSKKMAPHSKRFLFVSLISFCFALLAFPCWANDLAKDDWKSFRTRYKYHIQTIAVSEPHTDGSRTLIISEPPPHVTLQGLAEIDPLFANARVYSNPVGHDGWVKDVVLEFPPSADSSFNGLVAKLTRYLYFTTYKTSLTPIPTSGRTSSRQKLDLTVSAAQLQTWLTGINGSFFPLLGGDTQSLQKILRFKAQGVYFSRTPGLVLWVFPRNADLSVHVREAREFALDSDLILGATGTGDFVALVGRERIVPCDVLPPLRAETIFLLASVKEDQLSQSYERTNFAAGKYDSDSHADWAPIYLSDELIDTEYGSLLNITDQLLKSWSLNGTVTYENFDYPAPLTYPFSKPIIQLLKLPVLTFNWNTTGAGYAVEGPQFTTVALHRTGALPVSYIPEGHDAGSEALQDQIDDDEARAYKFFADRNDPNLVRVVQYASLYQIFRRFNLHATAPPPVRAGFHADMTQEVVRILNQFADADRDTMKKNLMSVVDKGQLTRIEFDMAIESMDHLEEVQHLIRNVRTHWAAPGVERLAQMIVNPRANATHDHSTSLKLEAILRELPKQKQIAAAADLQSATKILASLDKPDSLLAKLNPDARREFALHSVAGEISEHASLVRSFSGASVVSLKQLYEKGSQRQDLGWIRTPSIVVSFTQQSMASGGHNLDSRITEFRSSNSVPLHKLVVKSEGEKKILFYNPADEAYPAELTGLVAKYGSYLDDNVLERFLNQTALKITPRPAVPRNLALGFSEELKPSIDRGLQREFTVSGVQPVGFRTVSQKLTVEQVDFAKSLNGRSVKGAIVERRSPTSILIYNGSNGQVVEATDTTGAVDVLSQIAIVNKQQGQSPLFVFKKGFTNGEAEGFGRSVRIDSQIGDVDVILETEESTAQEMRTLLADDLPDLKKIEISDPVRIKDFETGREGVEVPMKISFRNRLSAFVFRIRVFARGAAESLSALGDRAGAAVKDIIARITAAGEDWSAQRIAAHANRELAKQFGENNVRVILQQTKNHLITENLPSHAPVG
jgi:hypothetical protein